MFEGYVTYAVPRLKCLLHGWLVAYARVVDGRTRRVRRQSLVYLYEKRGGFTTVTKHHFIKINSYFCAQDAVGGVF